MISTLIIILKVMGLIILILMAAGMIIFLTAFLKEVIVGLGKRGQE